MGGIVAGIEPDALPRGASGLIPLSIDLSTQRSAERAAACRAELATTADPERRTALFAVLATTLGATAYPGIDTHPATVAAMDALHQVQQTAERAGTPAARAYSLMAAYAVDLSPEALPARVSLAREVLDLLGASGTAEVRAALLPTAYFMYLGALMESGDVHGVDHALSAELHGGGPLAEMLDSRFAVWFRCARACMDGHLPLAERLAEEGHRLAIEAADIDADAVWIGQLAAVRWMQGRVSEMEPVFLQVRQADPTELVWAAAVAWIWVRQGRRAAAQGLIGSLPPLASFPRGRNWLAAVAILAEVASEVGSDDLVDRLRRELEPFADRIVAIGLGVVCWGTVARPLALLSARQGRYDDAQRYYADAIRRCSAVGTQAWLGQAQVELAALHVTRGERAIALELAHESLSVARQLGLRAVEQRADRLIGSIDGLRPALSPSETVSLPEVAPTPTPAAPHEPTTTGAAPSWEVPRITVLGEFSVTDVEGRVTPWKSRKARTLLKILLARRGAAVARESAMQLLWPDERPERLRNRLAVALTTIRNALDPNRRHRPDTFVVASGDTIRLRTDRLSIDLEDFLRLAAAATNGRARSSDTLHSALAVYRGDAFPDEPYASWAEQIRRQAHLAFFALTHQLATELATEGDHLQRVELYRRILDLDPYDQTAHDGLIDALEALHATSHVAAARAERHRRMAELGLTDDGHFGP